MRNKVISIVALMLCVSAFFLPVTAYAATDKTPPTVKAWVNGDLLHVEAFDDTGVESAYINTARVNYRVDSSFDVLVSDYAGSDEYISVYAVDFAGNKSNVVQLKNPYYKAPAATPTPNPATPTPAPTTPPATTTPKPTTPATPTPTPTPAPAPTQSPEPEPSPEPTPEPTESAVPDESKSADGPRPFTPDGTGTVMDNATDGDGKEFFTITTEDESVFYLIIDRQRDSENVYLLNVVTEDDLLALAKKSDGTSQSAIPTPQPDPTPTPTPDPEPTPEPEPPVKNDSSTGTIIFIVIAALAAGGAGYYFKIYKPKQDAPVDNEDEYDEDDTDYADYEDEHDTDALNDDDYEFEEYGSDESDPSNGE